MENLTTISSRQRIKTTLIQEKGFVSIVGSSIDPDSRHELEKLLCSILSYAKNPAPTTIVDISLNYFNTRSANILWKIFKVLESLNQSQKSVTSVKWYAEDDDYDLIESAKLYQDICPNLPIQKIIFLNSEIPC